MRFGSDLLRSGSIRKANDDIGRGGTQAAGASATIRRYDYACTVQDRPGGPGCRQCATSFGSGAPRLIGGAAQREGSPKSRKERQDIGGPSSPGSLVSTSSPAGAK